MYEDIDALLKQIADFDLDALLKDLGNDLDKPLLELWDAPRKPRRTRNRNTGKPSKPNT
jgi:hypothetical protein